MNSHPFLSTVAGQLTAFAIVVSVVVAVHDVSRRRRERDRRDAWKIAHLFVPGGRDGGCRACGGHPDDHIESR